MLLLLLLFLFAGAYYCSLTPNEYWGMGKHNGGFTERLYSTFQGKTEMSKWEIGIGSVSVYFCIYNEKFEAG